MAITWLHLRIEDRCCIYRLLLEIQNVTRSSTLNCRWFVYRLLSWCLPDSVAIVLSSLSFMAHHVVLMVVFFGLTSPLAYLFSFGVAIGGGVWAWLYGRSGNFVAAWLRHAIVDMALFVIGYDLSV